MGGPASVTDGSERCRDGPAVDVAGSTMMSKAASLRGNEAPATGVHEPTLITHQTPHHLI